jgi:hypothetical protein
LAGFFFSFYFTGLRGNIMPNGLGILSFGMSGLEDFFGFGY